MGGMVPAQQGFETHQLSVREDLRLILEPELFPIEGTAKIAHEFHAFPELGIDLLGKHLEAVLAVEFGMIHGGIGMLLQDLRLVPMFRIMTDANARAHRVIAFSDE